MPAYASTKALDVSKSCKARGSHLRVHFKNTHATANAIKGLTLKRAKAYLQEVLDHKNAVPFYKFKGGISHHAQGKYHKTASTRWPEKSVRFVRDILRNAESNAENKPGLDADSLIVGHIQVNRAPKLRRRTYRAHGRINAYMASNCHVEMILTSKAAPVKKAEGKDRNSRRQQKLAQGASAVANA